MFLGNLSYLWGSATEYFQLDRKFPEKYMNMQLIESTPPVPILNNLPCVPVKWPTLLGNKERKMFKTQCLPFGSLVLPKVKH